MLLSSGGGRGGASFSSSTRALFATGRSEDSGSGGHNTIEYVTIASAGDAIDFGDLQVKNVIIILDVLLQQEECLI